MNHIQQDLIEDAAERETKTQTKKTPRTEYDVLVELADARNKGDEDKIQHYRRILADVRSAKASGETGLADPSASETPLFSDEELAELMEQAKAWEAIREATAAKLGHSQPGQDPAGLQTVVPTYDLHGAERVEGLGWVFSVDQNPERSQPNYTLAGFASAVGRPVRAARLALWVPEVGTLDNPADDITPEVAAKYQIPYPETPQEQAEVGRRFGHSVNLWARYKQKERVLAYAQTYGLVPIPGDPAGMGTIQRWTIPLIDYQTAWDACQGSLSEVHYLKDFFSQVDGRGGQPDWRVASYIAVEPEVFTLVTEILGQGKTFDARREITTGNGTITDGTSLFFPGEYQLDHVKEAYARMGRDLDDDQAWEILERQEARSELEFQFRAAEIGRRKEGTFRDFLAGDHKVVRYFKWMAKGKLVPVSKRVLQTRVDAFRETTRELFRQGHESQAMGLLNKYEEALDIIRRVQKDPNDVALLVRGDQIKVSRERATRGTALVAGTYLKGKEPTTRDGYGTTPVVIAAGTGGQLSQQLKRAYPEQDEDGNTTGYDLHWRTMQARKLDSQRKRAQHRNRFYGEQTGRYKAQVRHVDLEEGTDYEAHYEGPRYTGSACVHVPEEPAHQKPAQFRVSGNPQYTQLLSTEAIRDLARFVNRKAQWIASQMTTPVGVARIRSEATALARQELEARYASDILGEDTSAYDQLDLQLGDLDNLGEALLTGLVHLDEDGYVKQAAGQTIGLGHLHMLYAHRGQIDALAASMFSSVVRAQGITAHYGYLNWTVQNSRKLHQRLNGFDRAYSMVRDQEGRRVVTEPFETGLLDKSTAVFPERVIRPTNGDDDGDIINTIAAPLDTGKPERYKKGPRVWGKRVRVVKFELVGRYPLVDAPVLRAMPLGDRSLGDARNAEEAQDFREFIGVFAPRVPEGADLFKNIVLGESPRLFRLAKTGAKENIVKVKRQGELTLAGAWRVVEAKLVRNRTGWLTRLQERLCVLLAICRARQAEEIKAHGKASAQTRANVALYAHRAHQVSLLLEEELTGFKYDLQQGQPPYLSSDAFPYEHRELKDLVSLDYHGEVTQIGAVLKTHNAEAKGPGTRVLELYDENMPTPIGGWGMGTIVANHVLAHAGMNLVEAVRAVQTDVAQYHRALLRARRELDSQATADESEILRVQEGLELWRENWRETMREAEALQTEADAERLAGHEDRADYLEREIETTMDTLSRALRLYLTRLADAVEPEAMVEGLLARFQEKSDAVGHCERRLETLMEDPETTDRKLEIAERALQGARMKLENLSAELALLSGRLYKVFGAANTQVGFTNTRAERYGQALRVFTTGRDLPGGQGDVMKTADGTVHWAPKVQNKRGETIGAFVANVSGELYSLFVADGEEARRMQGVMPEPGEQVALVKVSPRRAVLLFGQAAKSARR